MRRILCFAATAAFTAAAFAFNPPVDKADGLELSIPGFDEDTSSKELRVRQVPAGEPLPFTVELRNTGDKSATGRLRIWLNDDWTLEGPAEESVTVKPGAMPSWRP